MYGGEWEQQTTGEHSNMGEELNRVERIKAGQTDSNATSEFKIGWIR
jgi:hypothetical protein